MSKLLAANFARLKKDKVFWVSMAVMFFYGALLAVNKHQEYLKYGLEKNGGLNQLFFQYAVFIGILCAVFVSLFIGTEYSDGTIRNKLVIGHSRSAIYLSNLIVSVVAALLMCLSFIAAVSAVGIPLFGFLEGDMKTILLMLLGSAAMTAAFCSLCTMASMISQNKAMVAVITIISVFALLIGASLILSRLRAPEFYDEYVLSDSVENPSTQGVPNPAYLRGSKREVYKFLLDFLPTGQALRYASMEAVHLWQMPLYSLSIVVATTGAGIVVFRKKNIK